jgi:hypothetical protein
MKRRMIAAALSFFGLAGTASAGPLIVTPAVRPPAGGSVRCTAANASATQTVRYSRTIYEFDGAVADTATQSLPPNNNRTTAAIPVTQGHCVVEVIKGGKRNVRVSLLILDSGGNVVAVVAGQ